MTLESPEIADKFVVDRRKVSRNKDVAHAVKKTRERLSQGSGNPLFDRELVKLHANAMVNYFPVVPFLSIVLTVAAVVNGADRTLFIWPLLTAICYLPLAVIARRCSRTVVTDIKVTVSQHDFLLAHFVSGLSWVYFVTMTCNTCGGDPLALLKAAVLLVIIAATAIVASSLRGAVLATFTLPVLAFGATYSASTEPLVLILFALLACALVFFTYIAATMHKSALQMLAFRSEKDELIAELETAKAMSDEARYRAEEANMAKSRFLASMSHELRTPLNAILGFSEVMSNEVLGPMTNASYLDYSRDIHESGQHLLGLINEILDLSRIEAGRYQLNEEPLNLHFVVEECCHMMELRARKRDIKIIRQLESKLPRLLADERAVRQITLNLMANALKFAPAGSEVRVRVGWTAGGGQYVSVKDSGPGIPADEIPIVLSAFGQGTIAIKNAEQGTGLGLPIVQGLLKVHGGEFQLHSKLREGTEAIAIFPATRVMDALPALPTKATGQRRP
ncbi:MULTISPECIES: sensor histidine kinase [Mesorhizobium]|uniref:histidine kinase n=1 Tax=Mesorhizobium denitrificans TaxID=2294114 RepID=A0A371X6L8_9HYPH|nr:MULTISPECIES: HAMP domain-containing sensor histidine kinase [Mesorhizobium]RFC64885.1 sensor histidine kinase [Mesorhizobium denitrificans]